MTAADDSRRDEDAPEVRPSTSEDPTEGRSAEPAQAGDVEAGAVEAGAIETETATGEAPRAAVPPPPPPSDLGTPTAPPQGPGEPAPTVAGAATQPPPGIGGAQDRPEVMIGAAFAGGFLAALILKRLGD